MFVDIVVFLYYAHSAQQHLGNATALQMLIDAGGDVDAMTKLCPHNWEDRWRSAFVAAMEGDHELKQFLVRHVRVLVVSAAMLSL